jgi:hypothetical protein
LAAPLALIDGAVARGIRVQIGVDPALNGGELR